jgi:hypothetical protein
MVTYENDVDKKNGTSIRLKITGLGWIGSNCKLPNVLPVTVDSNEPFLCWRVMQFIAVGKLHWMHKVCKTSLYSELKVKTSSRRQARFLANASLQDLPPDSRLLPNAEFDISHHWSHHGLICISCWESSLRQNLISVFSASTNGALVHWSVTDIGYYIKSRSR